MTIALLSTLLASTSAVPSSDRELFDIDTVDIIGSSEGGLVGKIFRSSNANGVASTTGRSGILISSVNQADETTLTEAIQSATSTHNRLRGATDDSTPIWTKRSKSKGKGGIGKAGKSGELDCKMKVKGAKGMGKGPKNLGKSGKKEGVVFFKPRPNNNPTKSPTESESPTESVTHSPTDVWCPDEPSSSPSVSLNPTESSAPSNSPTISHQPSISAAPTDTISPSDKPSISSHPAFTPAPTVLESLSPNGASNTAMAFCQIYDAGFTENDKKTVIDIWKTGEAKSDQTKAASAALAGSIIDFPFPVDIGGIKGFKVAVTMKAYDNMVQSINDIERDLDEIVSPPVLLEVVGCAGKARLIAEAYYYTHKNDRRVLVDGSSLAVMNDWKCGEKSKCVDNECDVKCTTSLYYDGAFTSEQLDAILNWSFKQYFSMMDDVTVWFPMQEDLEKSITIKEFDTTKVSVDGVNELDTQQQRKGLKAAPFIISATGFLAVLLLLVLFVRRRNRYDQEEVSHLKLDESNEDDTYYNESDGHSVDRNDYNTRDIHIVGEGDSVISHWTGYTGNSRKTSHDNYEVSYTRSGLMKGHCTDVHPCSSATCDICAESRKNGVNFVKTGVTALPARTHSLPSDASREYITEDTVEL